MCKKMKKALTCFCLLALLIAATPVIPVQAAAQGIYLASANPYYAHPQTGVIEDPGQNPGIGQGMTESATYRKALIEVDAQGNTFVTVRLQLMDNVSNVSFQADGHGVSHTVMQENYGTLSKDNTTDFRMQVSSENTVLRCSMYVAPMGRDVIFYINFSNLQSGSGDFVTSIELAPTEAPTQAPTEPPVETTVPETTAAETMVTETTVPETSAVETTVPETAAVETTVPETTAAETTMPETTAPETVEAETTVPETAAADSTEPQTTESSAVETTEAMGLQEFDNQGNQIDHTEPAKPAEESGNTALWVILGVAAVGAVGFCIWYFGFFKKKK